MDKEKCANVYLAKGRTPAIKKLAKGEYLVCLERMKRYAIIYKRKIFTKLIINRSWQANLSLEPKNGEGSEGINDED